MGAAMPIGQRQRRQDHTEQQRPHQEPSTDKQARAQTTDTQVSESGFTPQQIATPMEMMRTLQAELLP
ncbi:hypothetical protein N7516_008536 [Penicillium verrucosum]|uniref:uncharacterized protein n=1 Tax=Penicillium verrucosum TaxID=60171 RepID=UPI002545681E|nr:uncharacterized protein N7516_008536 [Penicillium verrucosum]KAJ5926763.1 hypothetical protein N7516_008536 [Penicillium verrucosum]